MDEGARVPGRGNVGGFATVMDLRVFGFIEELPFVFPIGFCQRLGGGVTCLLKSVP